MAEAVMQFRDVLQALEQQGVVAEPSGESPTTWRIVLPMDTARALPIVEVFQLSVPCFEEDYEYEWTDAGHTLLIRER